MTDFPIKADTQETSLSLGRLRVQRGDDALGVGFRQTDGSAIDLADGRDFLEVRRYGPGHQVWEVIAFEIPQGRPIYTAGLPLAMADWLLPQLTRLANRPDLHSIRAGWVGPAKPCSAEH